MANDESAEGKVWRGKIRSEMGRALSALERALDACYESGTEHVPGQTVIHIEAAKAELSAARRNLHP